MVFTASFDEIAHIKKKARHLDYGAGQATKTNSDRTDSRIIPVLSTSEQSWDGANSDTNLGHQNENF